MLYIGIKSIFYNFSLQFAVVSAYMPLRQMDEKFMLYVSNAVNIAFDVRFSFIALILHLPEHDNIICNAYLMDTQL